MDDKSSTSTQEAIVTVSSWLVGFGILVLALAPFSLPFLILAAAFALPLLLALIPLALLAAVGIGLRAIWRSARTRRQTALERGRRALPHRGIEAQ